MDIEQSTNLIAFQLSVRVVIDCTTEPNATEEAAIKIELALQVTEGGTPEQRRFALEQALAEASPGNLEVLLIESDALGAPTVLLTQVWRSDGDR